MSPQLDAAYLESLFLGARLAIVACDPDGRIVAWNPAAAKLFGGEPAFRTGAAVAAIFPEAERESIDDHLAACLNTLEPEEFRCQLGGTEEEPIVYGVLMSPVLEPDGNLRGVAVWLRDVTTRIRLGRSLKKQERLSHLGRLAGAVSHHYSNLINCIAIGVDFARHQNTLVATRNVLQRIDEPIARATRITAQLQAFAQADHRSADLADLTELVLYFCDEQEPRLHQRHIRLVLDWQHVPIIPVLREQFLIVLSNLVDNAIEAMPGGGLLTVTLARRDEETVSLSIADTGGGIPADRLEHIFEPFVTTKGELACGPAHNAGMGLAVVHGLVGEMHGMISAANVPGRGARFDIVLPIQDETDRRC